jgi:DNA-binding MarR family transcriptional regulator
MIGIDCLAGDAPASRLLAQAPRRPDRGPFDRTLTGEAVTRRHWQALHTLQERPSTQAAIAEALAPFLADDPGAEERVIDELVAGGWVERGEDSVLKLTPVGTEVHAALLERIQATPSSASPGWPPRGRTSRQIGSRRCISRHSVDVQYGTPSPNSRCPPSRAGQLAALNPDATAG